MNKIKKLLATSLALLACSVTVVAQDKKVHPDVSYARTPRELILGGMSVSGIEGYEDYMLTSISGLQVGQKVSVPGNEITDAVKRYWRHGLFSFVQISADSIVGNKVYLHIKLSAHGVHSVNVSSCFRASYLFISVTSTAPVNTSIHSAKVC